MDQLFASIVGYLHKITTVPKSNVGAHIGRLDDEDILRLNQAVSPRGKRKMS
jgi:mRNA-degrading endonuclease toxin of MazEF toxin-antitoxin module